MASARLLRLPKLPSGTGLSKEFTTNSSFSFMGSRPKTVMMCLKNIGLGSNAPQPIRKPLAVKAAGCTLACMLITEPKTEKVVDLALLANIAEVICRWLEFVTKRRPWRFNIQAFVEKAIIDCRFFTLLAIAGSLIGSVLCFVEGCFFVLESYFQYFQALSQMSEQGHVILLLIEAIDMFLVGTAMLIFGMALHVMFLGTNNFKGSTLSKISNLESVMDAKSKIGHAVILILLVEVLEKLKSITINSGLDLACFAGVVFLCSASIFLLSRIAVSHAEG